MLGFNMIDNMSDHNTSIEKLKKLNIKTIYPGHGKPFSVRQFLKNIDNPV
jgi:glyoxylase-like metal-dependent hydrolase (beta-lactamase superfamily II)